MVWVVVAGRKRRGLNMDPFSRVVDLFTLICVRCVRVCVRFFFFFFFFLFFSLIEYHPLFLSPGPL